MIEGVYLQCTTSGHNKHYYAAVTQQSTGLYNVMVAWGRIDSELQQNMNGAHSSESGAVAVLSKLVREKIAKGYTVRWRPGMMHRSWKHYSMALPASVRVPTWFFDPPQTMGTPVRKRPKSSVNVFIEKEAAAEEATDVARRAEKKEKGKKSKLRRPDADWNF